MNATSKILLFTGDENFSHLLKKEAPFQGFEIASFDKNIEGLTYLCNEEVKACIIDSTPIDLYLLHEIRFIMGDIPVLLVSQRMLEEEKAKTYELGCDNYLIKPVGEREIFAGLNNVIARAIKKSLPGIVKLPITDILKVGQSSVNFRKRLLTIRDKPVRLTQKQADLLELFCLNKGGLITKDIIAKEVWNTEKDMSVSLLVYIHRLRKIFKDDPSIEIQNVHGLGYVFVEKRIF